MDFKLENKVTRREELLKNRNDCDVDTCKCLKCDSIFSSIKTLYFHMFSIHADERVYYACPICDITFVQLWTVCRHLIKVHKKSKEEAIDLKSSIKATFASMNCKKNTSKLSSDLEDHIADYKAVTCRYCSRDFSTPANLRRHIARHLGLARYWCTICDYKTFDRSECQNHIKRTHSVNETNQFITTKK